VEWPTLILPVLGVPASSATMSSASDNFAIDCTASPSLYTRAMVYFFYPTIIVAGVVVGMSVWSILRGSTMNMQQWKEEVWQGVSSLLYVAHPGVLQGLVSLVQCEKVGSQEFALKDMNVHCASSSFKTLLTFVILFVVLYGFGLLVFVFSVIKKKHSFMTYFGFLIGGLTDEKAYWEVLLTTRKIVIALLAVGLSASGQAYFATWILFVGFIFTQLSNPYRSTKHFSLDQASTIVLLITITTGSLFNTDIPPTSALGYVLSMFLILLNLITVCGIFFHPVVFRKIPPLFQGSNRKPNQANEMKSMEIG